MFVTIVYISGNNKNTYYGEIVSIYVVILIRIFAVSTK